MKLTLKILTLLLIVNACGQKTIRSFQDYASNVMQQEWLTRDLDLNFIRVKVIFLPPEYLALRDLDRKLILKEELHETLEYYRQTTTALIELNPVSQSEYEKRDVMFMGITNYQDYKKRVEDLSFNLNNNFFLMQKEEEVSAILSNIENTYGITEGRKAHIVFPTPFQSLAPDTKIKFYDNIFQSGIHTIPFDLEHAWCPDIDLNKII